VEDDRVGNEKLLVAKSNKKCRILCGRIQYMLEDKKSNRNTSRKIEAK